MRHFDIKKIEFKSIVDEKFISSNPTIYRIIWDNINFDFLIHRNLSSNRLIIFGNGDVDKTKGIIPFFQRNSWIDDLKYNAIFYFDPTILLGEASLCWCYGTDKIWYLERIAFLLLKIINNFKPTISNLLFFGSSGGGFTSIALASFFSSACFVINPQLDCTKFWPSLYKKFVTSVNNKDIHTERLKILQIFKYTGNIPEIFLMQNILAKNDIDTQIIPFLSDLSKILLNNISFNIELYCDTKGHKGLPSKDVCLQRIEKLFKMNTNNFSISSKKQWMQQYEFILENSKQYLSKKNSFNIKNISAIPDPTIYFKATHIIDIAEDIMQHKVLYVSSNLQISLQNNDAIDWNIEFSQSPNTFQLYLQCLNVIQPLLMAYRIKKTRKYLEFIAYIVKSWHKYSISNFSQNNKFIWQDHAVALRLENLMFYLKTLQDNKLPIDDFVLDLAYKHGEWLADDSHYTKNHNHGIMQDQALLHIAHIFEKNEWKEHSIERLEAQFINAFNSEMIPTENSPSYAFLVPNLFKRIGKFLLQTGIDIGKQYIDAYKNVKNFQKWIVKPNGFLAQKGDTANIPNQLYGSKKDILRKNCKKSIIFPRSGYYFYRSIYDNDNKLDTWKMLSSGYCNTTHKHADDCSFMLYSKGYDIFVDCGVYGYKQDDFRRYFKSAHAHNQVIVDNNSYSCNKSNFNNVGVSSYNMTEEYDLIHVFNKAYDNVSIDRFFISSDDITFILDICKSPTKHEYSQIFHLSEYIKILDSKNDIIKMEIADTKFYVTLQQINKYDSSDIINGNVNTPGYGIISRGGCIIQPITTLKYNSISNISVFATLITIEDVEGNIRFLDTYVTREEINFDIETNILRIKDKIIELNI